MGRGYDIFPQFGGGKKQFKRYFPIKCPYKKDKIIRYVGDFYCQDECESFKGRNKRNSDITCSFKKDKIKKILEILK